MKKVIIIGAGIGGMSAALYLRMLGYNVTIIEKNYNVGGKMNKIIEDGFSFDLGPTVITMPFVIENLFKNCNENINDYLNLLPIDPACRYFWSDGLIFDAFHNKIKLNEEISKIFTQDSSSFKNFLNEIKDLYEATKDVFLFNKFEGFKEFFKFKNLKMITKLHKFKMNKTVFKSLKEIFIDQKLIQLFSRFATYNGSSPYKAPATLNVIPHVEFEFGAWYPVGGIYEIAIAIEKLCLKNGVEIKLNENVTELKKTKDIITSVLSDKNEYKCDYLISNVDTLWTYKKLIEPLGIKTPKKYEQAERSCSGFLIVAKVKGNHSNLKHHNVFFSDNYKSEFEDIFDKKLLPKSMTIYVSISSKTDITLAPNNCENWYVLVNAPSYGLDINDLDSQKKYVELIFERLKTFDVNPEVISYKIIPPSYIEQTYNSLGGAIYGSSSNSIFSAFLRPRSKVPKIKNMFFCGGSSHPGGGVPLVVLSGKIVSEEISLLDLKK
jgi:phytoene desaturase